MFSVPHPASRVRIGQPVSPQTNLGPWRGGGPGLAARVVRRTGLLHIFRCRVFPQTLWVDVMERCGNRRPRVERLVFAWNQGVQEDSDPAAEPDDPLIGAAAEPRR